MNNRRKLVIALGASTLASSFGSFAQPLAGKMHRIGFLGAGSAASSPNPLEALRVGLRELGYAEGKSHIIEFRWAEGKYESLPELAAELVNLNVDLIVTNSTPAALAAQKATTAIPIVMVAVADPVGIGLIKNLARPGGNVTGFSNLALTVSVDNGTAGVH
jgi:putative ABC transport system substrate-binding protein